MRQSKKLRLSLLVLAGMLVSVSGLYPFWIFGSKSTFKDFKGYVEKNYNIEHLSYTNMDSFEVVSNGLLFTVGDEALDTNALYKEYGGEEAVNNMLMMEGMAMAFGYGVVTEGVLDFDKEEVYWDLLISELYLIDYSKCYLKGVSFTADKTTVRIDINDKNTVYFVNDKSRFVNRVRLNSKDVENLYNLFNENKDITIIFDKKDGKQGKTTVGVMLRYLNLPVFKSVLEYNKYKN